jgi:ornithine cyclodeaminase
LGLYLTRGVVLLQQPEAEMNLKLIDADEVVQRLTMPVCIDLMADTQAAISAGEITLPLRAINPVSGGAGFFGLMPGELAAENVFGAKLVSLFPANPEAHQLPAIQGYILLFDRSNGTPTALIDAATVTAIRTAAASGAATRVLANDKASSVALLGYGVQAGTHLAAMRAVRDITDVWVWGPSLERAAAFAEREAAEGLEFHPVSDVDEAVASADIVCAISNAAEPIVKGVLLKTGAHVNLVGAHSPVTREADPDVFTRSRVFTEITEFALAEAGDLIIPINEGTYNADEIAGEIGAVISGDLEGRQSDDQVTVYKSLGNTAQDLSAASYLA